MTWTCSTCATTNEPNAGTCIACGARRDVPAYTLEDTRPVVLDEAPPPPPPSSSRRWWPAALIAAAGAITLIAVGVVIGTVADEDDQRPGGETVTDQDSTTPEDSASTATPSTTATTAAGAPTVSVTTNTAPSLPPPTTVTTAPTTTTPTTAATTSPTLPPLPPLPPLPLDTAPVVQMPSGSWITVLDSKDQAEFGLAETQTLAADLDLGGFAPAVIDSSAHVGLNPGYWAIVLGPFATEDEANAVCQQIGRPVGGPCYARAIG